MELLQILPNLGVGVAAVVIMYLMYKGMLERMKEKDAESAAELREREMAMRSLEKEVRDTITAQLSENTRAMKSVIEHLRQDRIDRERKERIHEK